MFFKDHDVTGIARLRRRQQLSRVEKRMLTPFGGGKAPTQLTWLRERKKGGDEQQESLVVRHSAKCSSVPQLVPENLHGSCCRKSSNWFPFFGMFFTLTFLVGYLPISLGARITLTLALSS
jgi:hypothetical protein